MFDSQVQAFQRRGRAPEGSVDRKAEHVSQELRSHASHYPPGGARPGDLGGELVGQRGEDALDTCPLAAVPPARSRLRLRSRLLAAPQRIPEPTASTAEEPCQPLAAVTVVGETARHSGRFASAANRCSATRRSPALAELRTKSQSAPVSLTKRCSRKPRKKKPRKNCCFAGQ